MGYIVCNELDNILCLIDFRQLKRNIWGGILAAVLQLVTDTQAIIRDYIQ